MKIFTGLVDSFDDLVQPLPQKVKGVKVPKIQNLGRFPFPKQKNGGGWGSQWRCFFFFFWLGGGGGILKQFLPFFWGEKGGCFWGRSHGNLGLHRVRLSRITPMGWPS